MMKAWILIPSPREKERPFPALPEGQEWIRVRLDKKGRGTGKTLRAACRRGIREFYILKTGPLPESWEKDVIPLEIEEVRRDFLDMDLHYLPRQ